MIRSGKPVLRGNVPAGQADQSNICMVSPAFGRYSITNLVLSQRRHLCDTLEADGFKATCVVIADDENLDIARSFGFHTIEMGNEDLGAKFNAGYKYAAGLGAGSIVHIGSDDWCHPAVFDVLKYTDLNNIVVHEIPEESTPIKVTPQTRRKKQLALIAEVADKSRVARRGACVIAQDSLMAIDTDTGKAVDCLVKGRLGCIPWIVPSSALHAEDFSPIKPGLKRGMDGALASGLTTRPIWHIQRSLPWWLVDWKSSCNITAFSGTASALGGEAFSPWEKLKQYYPHDLVEEGKRLCL